jgi:acyl-CoA reductase-like NAD-dependent aldehyde dehydrogenase
MIPDGWRRRHRHRQCVHPQVFERDPNAAAGWVGALFKAAGLPDGVFSVVNGETRKWSRIIDHPG